MNTWDSSEAAKTPQQNPAERLYSTASYLMHAQSHGQETGADLPAAAGGASSVSLFPTGVTELDRQIHQFHNWTKRRLQMPACHYIQDLRLGRISHPSPDRLAENQRTLALYKDTFTNFLWTGIECSNPESPDGERWDQLALTGLYDPEHRSRQIGLMRDTHLTHVRLGIPNHRIDAENSWDALTDMIDACHAAGLKISLDMQHFGLPSGFRNDANPEESVYLNPAWPKHFVDFTLQAYERCGEQLAAVTLINEPLITNRFSATYWNEAMPGTFLHPRFLHFFIRRALLIGQAAVEARFELERRLEAQGRRMVFIHNESCEFQPDDPQFNAYTRFLGSDLILGQDWLLEGDFRQSDIFQWMSAHVPSEVLIPALEFIRGMHERFYETFGKTMRADTVFGVDYYIGCETVKPGYNYALGTNLKGYAADVACDRRRGLARICIDYWNRYQLPILHTETNFSNEHGDDWGMMQLVELAQLMKYGIPVLGFTWYSLMDQFNWDNAMQGSPQDVRLWPVGLYRWPDYAPRTFTTEVLAGLQQALAQPSSLLPAH